MIISVVDDFFTNEIKTLQHKLKKWVEYKIGYIEK